MPEQRNLILAIVLSVTIILAFQYFYELPRIKEAQRQQAGAERAGDRAPSAPTAPARARHGRRPASPRRRPARRSSRASPRARASRSRNDRAARLARADRRAASTTSCCRTTRSARRPARPTSRCSARRARPTPISSSSAGCRAEEGVAVPGPTRCGRPSGERAAPRPAGDAAPGTTARGCASSASSRSTTRYMFSVTQRVVNNGETAGRRSSPTA